MGGYLAWLTQKTEEPKCNKGNFTQHAASKRVNLLNGRSFASRYERSLKDSLQPNVTIRCRYRPRPAPKNKCRH